MQWLQRWSYPPSPPYLCIAPSFSPTQFLLIFAGVFFPVKAQVQLVLSVEMQGLAKEFIEFVVQLIPRRQARDLEWDKGVLKMWKGQETRDGRLIMSLA